MNLIKFSFKRKRMKRKQKEFKMNFKVFINRWN